MFLETLCWTYFSKFYSSWDLDIHTDRRTDRARSTWLLILIKIYIYILYMVGNAFFCLLHTFQRI